MTTGRVLVDHHKHLEKSAHKLKMDQCGPSSIWDTHSEHYARGTRLL